MHNPLPSRCYQWTRSTRPPVTPHGPRPAGQGSASDRLPPHGRHGVASQAGECRADHKPLDISSDLCPVVLRRSGDCDSRGSTAVGNVRVLLRWSTAAMRARASLRWADWFRGQHNDPTRRTERGNRRGSSETGNATLLRRGRGGMREAAVAVASRSPAQHVCKRTILSLFGLKGSRD
jgi:hypothetical protein